MFRSVLIANRGEIAVRVARTLKAMNIRSIGVYSDADAEALHVRAMDAAYRIGPPPALESYLNIPALLAAARESGAEAVHPGYGFLSENASFAQAVLDAGLVWIGPPPAVIAALGDKVAAKELAIGAGVPTVPGYAGEDQSPGRMAQAAQAIGYPVMLKAAAGGGGKGMRAVHSAADLPGALEGARREAYSAFGDDRVFLEKLLVEPRHIEIQILADCTGNTVYLGERDCSAQRRHQKVIEESPSPVLTAGGRAEMGEAAVRLASAAGYVNAGTVEFLYACGDFYFLEVNTRLQVEHPVTELVTGLDLVRLQVEIAAGEQLPLRQGELSLSGHAIEARIYAEDPDHNFLPAPGPIEVFRPPQGTAIRNDVGVEAGAEVSPYYDPMLAKLIVSGRDRAAAVVRLQEALAAYRIGGTTTNVQFLSWLAGTRAFIEGRLDTGFIDRTWLPPGDRQAPAAAFAAAALAAIAAEMTTSVTPAKGDPWLVPDAWRAGGLSRTFRYRAHDGMHIVRLTPAVSGWEAVVDGEPVPPRDANAVALVVREVGRTITAEVDGASYDFAAYSPGLDLGQVAAAGGAGGGLSAPMPGTVVKVAVEGGQGVAAHQPLVVLEAMKMEHVIEAPRAGIVAEVLVKLGQMVPAGTAVVRMEEM